jgi:prepilin-type N-terminal cleavage/methylation domain-containing protein
MPGRNRSAFTLVELLVVVVIIGILVGLLIPAVSGARERARQTQCSNHQKELAVALRSYESAKSELPGYVDNFGSSINTARLSWIVLLLPNLGREDLWAEWREPRNSYNYKRANAMVDEAQLRCPSDSRSGPGVLSYAANCGIQAYTATPSPGGAVPENQAHGVFRNRHDWNTAPPPFNLAPAPFTTDRIPDGAANTLLFSENTQASFWAPPLIDNDNAQTWTGRVDATTDLRELHVGLIWTPGAPGQCQGINQCREAEIAVYDTAGMPLNPPTPLGEHSAVPLINFARPSSYHVGGVVTTLADGHQEFKDEQIDYDVFRRLMASNDQRIFP